MRELIELRTQCTKIFDLGNNQKQIVAKTSAIHYKNIRGEWNDLDPTIVGLKVEKAPYNVELFTDKIGYKGIDPSGKNIELELMDIPFKTPIIEKNKAIYKDIETDVDFEFEFMPNRIKAKRILKSVNANKKAVYRSKREKDAMGRLSNLGVDNEGRKAKISVLENISGLDEKIITQVFKDQVMKMNKTTRKREWSSEVKYPVIIDPTSTFTLAANNNDGMASAAIRTAIRTNDPRLLISMSRWPYTRFSGITIAQGSTINSATLKIYALGESAAAVFNIKGDGHSNPAVPTVVAQVKSPTTVAGTISEISITNTVTTSYEADKANYLLKSINVTSIVQTLVTNFAYTNEAMMFFYYRNSGVGVIYARDWGTTKDAELVINFTEGGATYRRRILVGG
jgi:hypothetical protein